MRHLKFITISALAILALQACEKADNSPALGQSGKVVVSGQADIGGAFELINQNGQITTQDDIKGKPQLIYFGFSFCPDVCPLALQQMGASLAKVDPKGSYFRPIFISVDPERDTPEALKIYVTNNGFPKGLMGLTGSQEQVDVAKTAYKIFSQKADDPDSAAGYTVDHVSLIFLMNSDGSFADVFTHQTTTEDIISRLAAYKKTTG